MIQNQDPLHKNLLVNYKMYEFQMLGYLHCKPTSLHYSYKLVAFMSKSQAIVTNPCRIVTMFTLCNHDYFHSKFHSNYMKKMYE